MPLGVFGKATAWQEATLTSLYIQGGNAQVTMRRNTLYSFEAPALARNTPTLTHTLVLCSDTMGCSRRRKLYEMGERC